MSRDPNQIIDGPCMLYICKIKSDQIIFLYGERHDKSCSDDGKPENMIYFTDYAKQLSKYSDVAFFIEDLKMATTQQKEKANVIPLKNMESFSELIGKVRQSISREYNYNDVMNSDKGFQKRIEIVELRKFLSGLERKESGRVIRTDIRSNISELSLYKILINDILQMITGRQSGGSGNQDRGGDEDGEDEDEDGEDEDEDEDGEDEDEDGDEGYDGFSDDIDLSEKESTIKNKLDESIQETFLDVIQKIDEYRSTDLLLTIIDNFVTHNANEQLSQFLTNMNSCPNLYKILLKTKSPQLNLRHLISILSFLSADDVQSYYSFLIKLYTLDPSFIREYLEKSTSDKINLIKLIHSNSNQFSDELIRKTTIILLSYQKNQNRKSFRTWRIKNLDMIKEESKSQARRYNRAVHRICLNNMQDILMGIRYHVQKLNYDIQTNLNDKQKSNIVYLVQEVPNQIKLIVEQLNEKQSKYDYLGYHLLVSLKIIREIITKIFTLYIKYNEMVTMKSFENNEHHSLVYYCGGDHVYQLLQEFEKKETYELLAQIDHRHTGINKFCIEIQEIQDALATR